MSDLKVIMKKLRDLNSEYYDDLEKLQALIDERGFYVQYNGHFEFKKEFLNLEISMSLRSLPPEALKTLVTGQKLSEPVQVSFGVLKCPYCAEYLKFNFDGEQYQIISPCKYPGGLKEVKIELNVPSGKMVFANDLRQWFKVQGDYDINCDVGILETILAYEKVGMAHGFVGNTCPNVFKADQRTLTISAQTREDYWDNEKKEWLPRPNDLIEKETPQGKEVGGICTDLWWYCIVDYEDFKMRFLDAGGTKKSFNKYIKDSCDVVEVDPGVYSITHHFVHHDENPEGQPLHYANIQWKSEADKRNLYQQYKDLNYTIGQSYLASLKNYPTLYGFKEEELPKELSQVERLEKLLTFPHDRLESSVAQFLDHTFCTLGGGVDWHENGWGTSNEITPDTPDIKLPLVLQKRPWYPMSREYCALYLAAFDKEKWGDKVHLNSSFLEAAYNVINCIIRYGAEPLGGVTSEKIDKEKHDKELAARQKEAEEQVVIARECLQGLAKRYPGSVPDYCKDLLQGV